MAKKRKKKHALRNILIVLVILAAVLFVYRDQIQRSTVSAVTETVVKQQLENNGVSSEKTEEILNSISKDDKEEISKIVSSHLNADTISQVKNYAEENNAAGLQEYAQQILTPQEYQSLNELASKYSYLIQEAQ